MMDFPASPTTGTIVTFPNGQSYRWNGGQWDVISNNPIADPYTFPVANMQLHSSGTKIAANSKADGTGTDVLLIDNTGLITPGIKGITDGSNAPAGYVGEFLSNSGTTAYSWGAWGASVALSVTAGDWDVWGQWGWSASVGSGTVQTIETSLSGQNGSPTIFIQGSSVGNPPGLGQCTVGIAPQRWNITSTQSVFLVTKITGSGYTSVSGTGYLYARRRR